MSNYLSTDGLKEISLLPEAPLRPEARGICHICHMVNPALHVVSISSSVAVSVTGHTRLIRRYGTQKLISRPGIAQIVRP